MLEIRVHEQNCTFQFQSLNFKPPHSRLMVTISPYRTSFKRWRLIMILKGKPVLKVMAFKNSSIYFLFLRPNRMDNKKIICLESNCKVYCGLILYVQ